MQLRQYHEIAAPFGLAMTGEEPSLFLAIRSAVTSIHE